MTQNPCNVTGLLTTVENKTAFCSEASYAIYFTHIYGTIYCLGLAGNTFGLVVWARSGLRSTPVTYFQAICVADSLVLLMHALERFHDMHVQGVCQLVHVLFLAVQCFAIFLVLGLSVERYIQLCYPLTAGRLVTHKRSVRIILLLAALALLCSLCEAYIWHVQPDVTGCKLRHTTSQSFTTVYAILVLVLLFVLPLLLSMLLNVLVARRIWHTRQNSRAFSVAMVPDKHSMNLSVTFVSLYLAVCELAYAAVHIRHYFLVSEEYGGCALADKQAGESELPLTLRWRSYYIRSLPLLVVDVFALTSYAMDLTIFTLCSRTFRRSITRLFLKYRARRESNSLGVFGHSQEADGAGVE